MLPPLAGRAVCTQMLESSYAMCVRDSKQPAGAYRDLGNASASAVIDLGAIHGDKLDVHLLWRA